jgi:hypothetical protein
MLLGSYICCYYHCGGPRWERTRAVSPRSLDECRRDHEDRPSTGTRAGASCSLQVRVGGFDNEMPLASRLCALALVWLKRKEKRHASRVTTTRDIA